MSTITLPNIRVSSDLTVGVVLKDGGVAIDWSTLSNIKAYLYADAQRAMAGRCSVSVDEEDATRLVCSYRANKPQYIGVNRIVITCTYRGETKTFDKPALNFVRWTDDQAGQQITIDDPDVDVEIEVEDVSSSILEQAIAAALQAAADAEHAAHLIPNQVLLDCEQATAGANAAAEAANAAGITSVQVSVEDNEPGTPSAECSLANKVLSVIFHYLKGETGDAAGFGTISASFVEDGGDPSVLVTTSGPDTAKNIAFTLKNFKGDKGDKGDQGNTGSSVDYPYELVNNLTTNDATKGLTAAMGVQLEGEVSQLEAEVGGIDERTANLDADEEDALFVTDSDSNIIAKIDKDGVETTSVRTKQTNPLFYKDKVLITDEGGNVILSIDSNGIKTTKIEAVNVLKNDWLGKKVATYGDSVTAVNNGDFVPPFVITQNNWGNRVADYYQFGKQYGRGIGSTCFMWRGTSGGQVAWCKTATGEYVDRNDSYTYDNYEGHIVIPADCTAVRGDGCSWLRIVTMFPASIKSTIDAVLVMFHNDYHQDMDTAVEWVENSQTDPEWAASDEYETLGGDYNIGTVQGGIASVVMKLQAWMPQARIILMTPISGVYATDDGLDGDFDNTQSALMHTLAGVVKDIASRMSIPVIDNYSNDGINSLNRTSYIYDNIHPYTAKGSKALAASVIGQMKTILPAL